MALQLDGINQYAFVNDAASIGLDSHFSLMGWVNFSDVTQLFQSLFHKGPVGGSGNYDFYYHAAFAMYLEVSGIGWNHVIGLVNGVEYCLGVTRQIGVGTTFYIDGINVGFSNVNAFHAGVIDAQLLLMGDGAGYTLPLAAIARDFRIYKGLVFTDDDMMNIFLMNGSDKYASNLSLRCLFNDKPNDVNSDGLADEVRDISGNGNHGTCLNTPVFKESYMKLHTRRN